MDKKNSWAQKLITAAIKAYDDMAQHHPLTTIIERITDQIDSLAAKQLNDSKILANQLLRPDPPPLLQIIMGLETGSFRRKHKINQPIVN